LLRLNIERCTHVHKQASKCDHTNVSYTRASNRRCSFAQNDAGILEDMAARIRSGRSNHEEQGGRNNREALEC
jgi:hypothetical protein